MRRLCRAPSQRFFEPHHFAIEGSAAVVVAALLDDLVDPKLRRVGLLAHRREHRLRKAEKDYPRTGLDGLNATTFRRRRSGNVPPGPISGLLDASRIVGVERVLARAVPKQVDG